jgi:hypothetical protein
MESQGRNNLVLVRCHTLNRVELENQEEEKQQRNRSDVVSVLRPCRTERLN